METGLLVDIGDMTHMATDGEPHTLHSEIWKSPVPGITPTSQPCCAYINGEVEQLNSGSRKGPIYT